MAGSLHGKKAIITGASRGIGASIAMTFAREGAELVLAARSQKDLETMAGKLKPTGAKVHLVPTDMGNMDQVKALARTALQKAGGIDVLVSNAAISGPFKPVLEVSMEEWDEVHRINYLGPLLLTKELAGQMVGRAGANVVIVSSIRGLAGTPGGEPYASTKAALNHLVRTLACELGPSGVRVNGLLPGPVDTDMTKGYFDGNQPLYEFFGNIAPLKGWTQADDLAEPCLFLASDAARRVTGHLLVVDAGLSSINQDAFGPPESLLK